MTEHSPFMTSSVRDTPPCAAETGNLAPLLHEIRHALSRWLDDRSEHSIDLRSIPMAPGEEARLLEQLGRGEVQAQITGLGRSELVETHYPGVWLLSHYGDDEQIIGRQIEITDCPWLLKSQPEDVTQALQRLQQQLTQGREHATPLENGA